MKTVTRMVDLRRTGLFFSPCLTQGRGDCSEIRPGPPLASLCACARVCCVHACVRVCCVHTCERVCRAREDARVRVCVRMYVRTGVACANVRVPVYLVVYVNYMTPFDVVLLFIR